ncbi:MAG: J domain-containing protein [Fimbriimonadales bacterium]|nr:J domain-containing protein [Fimbriimonadales bacterium]
MALGKRITRLMRTFIEEQWQRLETLVREEEAESRARAEAMHELEHDLSRSRPSSPLTSAPSTTPRQAQPIDPVQHAYRVLGLPENADLATVRRTYRQLSTKSEPSRFPEGSPERAKAEQIHTQIEQAYRVLLRHLDPSADRFRDLELP